MRYPASKCFQTSIAILLKARLPVVEQALAHSSLLARFLDVLGRFPDFEEQLALLGGGKTKVSTF